MNTIEYVLHNIIARNDRDIAKAITAAAEAVASNHPQADEYVYHISELRALRASNIARLRAVQKVSK